MDEKQENKQKIAKDMNIMEIIVKYPQTREVFMKYGFHCLGCHAAQFESLEQGAMVHGIDVDKFVKDLNEAVDKPIDEKDKNDSESTDNKEDQTKGVEE